MPAAIMRLAVLAVLMLAGLVRSEPPARADAYGDSLPDDALARLGTSRIKLGEFGKTAAFSPDGKWIAVAGRTVDRRAFCMRVLDASSGKEEKQLPYDWNYDFFAFSADGKVLVAGSRTPSIIRVYDPTKGAEVRRFDVVTPNASRFCLSADGAVVACNLAHPGAENTAAAWDTTTGTEITHFTLAKTEHLIAVAVSRDGKWMAGRTHRNGLIVWNLAAKKEAYRLADVNVASVPSDVTFSPDGKRLAVASWGSISIRETATGKVVHQFACRREAGAPLTFSPDGKTLAAADERAVQRWDTETGKRLDLLAGLPGRPQALLFGEKGQLLALGVSGEAAWVWDVTAGKAVGPTGGHTDRVTSIAFAADGKTVLTAAADGVLVWDARTAKQLRRVAVKEGPNARFRDPLGLGYQSFHLCTDGKRFLGANRDAGLTVLDAASGEFELEFELSNPPMQPDRLSTLVVLSADGSLAAVTDIRTLNNGEVRLVSLTTGRELRRVKAKNPCHAVALSADGKTVAVASARAGVGINKCIIQRWDTDSGKEADLIEAGSVVQKLAFSPDGALLAAGTMEGTNSTVLVWDTATGREHRRLKGDSSYCSNVAFSPDGRTLAAGTDPGIANPGPRLRVWELASGGMRWDQLLPDPVFVLAYSPDSRTLAAASLDTTVVLWDVGGRLATKPLPKELDGAWPALAQTDASQAHQAMAKLGALPTEAVKLFQSELRPAPALEDEKLKRLIADLDDDAQATRNKASAELADIGVAAKAALENALKGTPSKEQQLRIESLLKRLADDTPTADQLRQLRAVEVLERLNTPEARALLKSLAEGRADARQTRAAKEALARLNGRSDAGL
jgi:WD40 repeat protein